VKAGSALDREARLRGTSVYLPGKVLPMLPEVISSNLASLQEGKLRYTKSVLVEISPEGTVLRAEVMPGAIKVTKRLDFDCVSDFFRHPRRYRNRLPEEVRDLLVRMRELAELLRRRRIERGFLELDLPEVKLELDEEGRFKAARLVTQEESHRVIEEFMLTANEAVAQYLSDRGLPFLRRTHEDPDPVKLKAFAEFVRALNYRIDHPQSRADLQAVLRQSASRPDRYAVHYSLLRSMKRAEYSPDPIGHYGIASGCYCHFTSPIRRYPDLLIHRLLGRHWKRGRVSMDERELEALGEHCTYTERRAADAEAELIKLKVLSYLAERLGLRVQATISSVHDFGFFAQLDRFFVEGLVHVRSLGYERFRFDPDNYTLRGTRSGRIFRLGDRVRVRVAHVDLSKRRLELQLQND
jgi:ribonuclease R